MIPCDSIALVLSIVTDNNVSGQILDGLVTTYVHIFDNIAILRIYNVRRLIIQINYPKKHYIKLFVCGSCSNVWAERHEY